MGSMMLIQFQVCKKVCHQARSDRTARFRWTQWSRSCTVDAASMRLCRKVCPGLTTIAAWFRRPIRESRSCYFPEPLGVRCSDSLIHLGIVAVRWRSFSCERWSSCCTMSISIPRKVQDIVDPSFFSGATGNPSSPHNARVM